ncbi:MAG: hypothetical protein AAFX06_31710, partial [Planctomycetota bacterium]
MSYFVIFLIVWGIITLVGHGTWVFLAALVQSLGGFEKPASTKTPSMSDDVQAMDRVLSFMTLSHLLAPDQASSLREKMHQLADGGSRPTSEEVSDAWRASEPEQPKPVQPLANSDQTALREHTPAATPVVAQESIEDAETGRPEPVAEPTREPMPSLSESLASFLADHNIRWGELIAGALIVVCSIGLVISLWSTLTGLHRVVPSLIFLTGNAAIFGAGLYTLFRWRLPETSRAMLLIATLLVPLSIVAGLSTGGIDASAVRLNDPLVLCSLVAVGAVYSYLLWHSSRALVGTSMAAAMTLAVAGPAAMMPFFPTAIRTIGESGGWWLLASVLPICVSQTLILSRQCRHLVRTRIGRTLTHRSSNGLNGRDAVRRTMVLGVSLFSLAVTACYCVSMMVLFEVSCLPAAIACIPALVCLAASAESIASNEKYPKLALAGTVVASSIALGCCCVIVPALQSPTWLIAWGLSCSIAACLVAYLFQSHRWSLAAVFPIGIALALSSPALMGSLPWDRWRGMLGGESMTVSISIATLSLIFSRALDKTVHGPGLRIASATWGCCAVAMACVLSVSPPHLMGALPSWVLPLVPGLAIVGLLLEIRRLTPSSDSQTATWETVFANGLFVSTLVFWSSVFKPYVIGGSFPNLLSTSAAFIASAMTMALFEFGLPPKSVASKVSRHCSAFSAAAGLFVVMASTTASAPVSILMMSASALLLWWLSIRDHASTRLDISRFCIALTVAFAGIRYFDETLLTFDAVQSGSAFWGWSMVAFIAMTVLSLQDAATPHVARIATRLGDPSGSADGSLTSWHRTLFHPDIFLIASLVGTLFSAVFGFGSIAVRLLDSSQVAVGVPLLLSVALLTLHWIVAWQARSLTLMGKTIPVPRRLPVTAATLLWLGTAIGQHFF